MMKRLVMAITGVLLMFSLAACWGGGSKEPESTDVSEETSGPSLSSIFGTRTFDKPVGLEQRAGSEDILYIIEQPGRIVSMNLKHPSDKPVNVLDITERVNDDGNEQGLLGLAFHPKHPNQAYVNYTTQTHTVIARYDADPNQPERLDPSSEQILLTFEQPYANHNGGQLAFGPDGYLYIATGDGGSGGDPHNNGQNLNSLLGKILRIDVDRSANGQAYAIPADNPFIGKGKEEIYAYGLRNPWRFSFDEATGKLWAADVGQDRFEEINVVEKGKNYGWHIQEGTECFKPKEGCNKSGLEQPLFTYGRDQGVSITGGYVYRGEQLTEFVGWYVYADYGMGTLWALRQRGDGTVENKTLLQSDANITSFGRDSEGELYICTQDGEILRLF
ncbi:PQQ-dependent sugar dehydrogenase [Cohnella silvisoli]|uniref:PQQ-dependent sugar dehydrogenase n=1 Tax=Cohnella silvisoli TaxID=2873699 RepID=A0ABV1KLX8_9BACL|nr:PQQ-dependent sugar dehydrogenase [Cohnella silvisoli]MCD9020563.1 PQQ-dependent sugar dehydrogenase [Cohnella silvisoli]